jgi:hypothetical protein
MPRCALVSPGGTVIRVADNADPSAQTKSGYVWKLCQAGVVPSFDPTAEIITGPTFTVNANDVTEAWGKRNLTAQEISDRKDAAVSSINGGGFAPVLKILFNINNRVRVLEGQSALTMAQFKAAIKAAL